jgi:hypothetical protein
MNSTLTEKEEKLLSGLMPDTPRRRTFSEMLDRWQRILDRIENGYELGIFDYTNDLTVREILGRAADGVDTDLRLRVTRMLEPLDLRFKAATFVSEKPPFPGALARHPDAWWYRRLPNKLIGELKEDAHRWGLVA